MRNLPDKADFFCDNGHAGGMVDLGMLLNAAARSNQEALAQEERMSCTIEIEKLTEFHIGMLMYFFFLATAYEGAMADINTYDQPGVEDYKKILRKYLQKYMKEA